MLRALNLYNYWLKSKTKQNLNILLAYEILYWITVRREVLTEVNDRLWLWISIPFWASATDYSQTPQV